MTYQESRPGLQESPRKIGTFLLHGDIQPVFSPITLLARSSPLFFISLNIVPIVLAASSGFIVLFPHVGWLGRVMVWTVRQVLRGFLRDGQNPRLLDPPRSILFKGRWVVKWINNWEDGFFHREKKAMVNIGWLRALLSLSYGLFIPEIHHPWLEPVLRIDVPQPCFLCPPPSSTA